MRIQLKTKKSFEFPHPIFRKSEQRPKFEREWLSVTSTELLREQRFECQENKKLRGREQTLQLQQSKKEFQSRSRIVSWQRRELERR